MVEKDLLFVDKETKDAIVDELWNRISSQNLTSQQSPKAYMLGGQPGAGKSTSTRKLAAQYNRNILTVDLDNYRDQHPNYEALYEKYADDPSFYDEDWIKINQYYEKIIGLEFVRDITKDVLETTWLIER